MLAVLKGAAPATVNFNFYRPLVIGALLLLTSWLILSPHPADGPATADSAPLGQY